MRVVALDVQNLSYFESVKPILYDGSEMPLRDDEFETALLSSVLHHTSVPEVVLAEAARVARRLVVIEDVPRGRFHRHVTNLADSLMNLEFKGHPHSNRPDASWQRTFERMGLWITERRERWRPLGIWQVAYVLESRS